MASSLLRFNNSKVLNRQNCFWKCLYNSEYKISTSQKNRETVSLQNNPDLTSIKSVNNAIVPSKNWVSYGFDFKDEATDRNTMKATFFFTVTLCLVWGSFIWAYLPDTQMRDWAQRQGYLELRRREEAGLEPISCDFIDPQLIILPSDEELGNAEIII